MFMQDQFVERYPMSIFSSDHFSTPELKELERCAVDDGGNIGIGRRGTGPHVRRIQDALETLTSVDLSKEYGVYGKDTATAVTNYKNSKTPKIVQSWQSSADPIVGKRTIIALDQDMVRVEAGRGRGVIPREKEQLPAIDILLFFSGFVVPGGDEITVAHNDGGFRAHNPMRALGARAGFEKRYKAFQGSLDVDKGMTAAQEFIVTELDRRPVGKIIMYGYSAGGSNCLQLCRALEALNGDRKTANKPLIVVNLLVTVDAAERTDHPKKVDRSVAGCVVKNMNYFQTQGSLLGGAHGGPNRAVPSAVTGTSPIIKDIDMTSKLTNFSKQSKHSQVEDMSLTPAITDIKTELGI
jgi:peptidoglycan hydrolase-like protein with peptidoglycan-binding domain